MRTRTRTIAIGAARMALAANQRPNETNVTINQQPHDAADAARLLGELEHKAESRILESIKVGNTTFECVVSCWDEAMSDQRIYRAVFKMNGQNMEALYATHRKPSQSIHEGLIEAAKGLCDEIAQEIAAKAVGPALQAMMRSAGRG